MGATTMTREVPLPRILIYTADPEFLSHGRPACRGEDVDPEWWFADRGPQGSYAEALKVCRRCPLMVECGEWAIEHSEPYGLWGGLTPDQRAAARRCRRCRSGRCVHENHWGRRP